MKSIFLFLISLLAANTLALSQSKQTDESPYPKFVPYVAEEKTAQENINIDIKDLGKEQPAKWLSVDPMADKYSGWSPYNYTLNNPLRFLDPDGMEIRVNSEEVDENGQIKYLTYRDGSFYYGNGDKYTGNNSFIQSVLNSIGDINAGADGAALVNFLVESKNIVTIQLGSENKALGGFSSNL